MSYTVLKISDGILWILNKMKYFIDLGAYNGDTIKKALSFYKGYDYFIGFEPEKKLYKKAIKIFKNKKKVIIHRQAVDIQDGRRKLFLNRIVLKSGEKGVGEGSSLSIRKKTGNINKKRFEEVKTINFSKYILNKFLPEDFIVLKIDIEGWEYRVLRHMIKTGAIRLINKIYCEWHYKKIGLPLSRHLMVVNQLREIGFLIKGENPLDDFDKMVK